LRLRYAAGFSEGWGVYAEMLMADAGLFSDPAAMLGHIHWMLFRVTRGLADIDLHVRGVDTDRAAARIRESLGESVYFAPIDRDVVRITSDPGLRAAEAWVPLRITAARPRARHRWPQFHTPLLAFGRRRTEQIAG